MFRACQNPNARMQSYIETIDDCPVAEAVSSTPSQLKIKQVSFKQSPYSQFSSNYQDSEQQIQEVYPSKLSENKTENLNDLLCDSASRSSSASINVNFDEMSYRVKQSSNEYCEFLRDNSANITGHYENDPIKQEFSNIEFEESDRKDNEELCIAEQRNAAPALVTRPWENKSNGSLKDNRKENIQEIGSLMQKLGTQSNRYPSEETAVLKKPTIDEIALPSGLERVNSTSIREPVVQTSLSASDELYEKIQNRIRNLGAQPRKTQIAPTEDSPIIVAKPLVRQPAGPQSANKSSCSIIEEQPACQNDSILKLENQLEEMQNKYQSDSVSDKDDSEIMQLEAKILRFEENIKQIEEHSGQVAEKQEIQSPVVSKQVKPDTLNVEVLSCVRDRISSLRQSRKQVESRQEEQDIAADIIGNKIKCLNRDKLLPPSQQLQQLLESPESGRADSGYQPTRLSSKQATEEYTSIDELLCPKPLAARPQSFALQILQQTPQSQKKSPLSHIESKMQKISEHIKNSPIKSPISGNINRQQIQSFDLSIPSTEEIIHVILHCISTVFRYNQCDFSYIQQILRYRAIDYAAVAYFMNNLEQQLVKMVVELSAGCNQLIDRMYSKIQLAELHFINIQQRTSYLQSWDAQGSVLSVEGEFQSLKEAYSRCKKDLFDGFE